MPRLAAVFEKKTSSSSKGAWAIFPVKSKPFRPRSYVKNLEKVNSFILEHSRISEFCPLTIILLITRI